MTGVKNSRRREQPCLYLKSVWTDTMKACTLSSSVLLLMAFVLPVSAVGIFCFS